VQAQVPGVANTTGSSEAQPWQPPDITNLPLNWWTRFETSSPDEFQQRMKEFENSTLQKLQGLNGDDLSEAQGLLTVLGGQVDLLTLALRGNDVEGFEPIPTQESYTLDELLALHEQWREMEARQKVPQLRIEELQSKDALLAQRRDELLNQYNAVEPSAPDRILMGLKRVSARIDHELNSRNLTYQERRLEAYRQQARLLQDQQTFARAHLVGGETDWHAIEAEAASARAQANEEADKLTTLQHLLLEVLSAKDPKPSLEILRKQQLTRAAASQSLARVQSRLDTARANWYRFRSGTLDTNFDFHAFVVKTDDQVKEVSNQAEVWAAASQTTLVTPLPATGLNARKNIELAHSVAQETLSIIKQIKDAIDDLLLVEEILVSDMVATQGVFKSLGTRLSLLSTNVWDGMQVVLDYNLFHIADAAVTPGRIISMLMILLCGILLSWVIRHLLARLENRRKYAKSPAIYTLGRLLHYIIIITSVFVALGTIGLDFTNFALIAGALSVGIGFGLQSIVNNFVSGLILLFEGSLRVGDYIELDSGLRGTVKEINTRATVINTNDSVDMVVPNSEFVTTRLTNWTLRDPVGRLRIDFGVAYGSDKEVVKEAALEAASEVETILQHTPGREVQVRLYKFGDSSLDFQVLVWVNRMGLRRPGRTKAEFMWILETKLKERGIEIPFPQRDLHLRSGFPAGPSEKAEPEKDL
jgi:small-conductance mechanosensitive channel